ncbi:MAG: GNAT family N-acetyltransferase [Saprospiraceae bacterium]
MLETILERVHIEHLSDLSPLFDAYRVFYEKESDPIRGHQFLKERIENGESVVFISYTNKIASGFVQLYPLFSSTRMARLWLLNDLFVHPDFRGQGISIQLIEQAKIHCAQTNGCGLMLETAKSNDIGNQLYPRTGFTLDTEHHFYFWDYPLDL